VGYLLHLEMAEFRQLLNSLPSKPQFLLVAIAWIVLFQFLGNSSLGYASTPSMFSWLVAVYESNPDDSLGYMIPPLIVALLYAKRDDLVPLEKAPWVPALILLILALLLHVVGYLVQQVRVSLLAFGLGLWAVTGLFWGVRWMRATAFPFALMVFAVPLTAYTDSMTFHLRLLSTSLAAGFCKEVLNLSLIRDGTVVFHALPGGVRGFEFEVAPACSGIRSLTVVLLLTLVFGYLRFDTLWRRIALVVAAIPLAVIANVVRLVTVFTVGEAWGGAAGKRIETNLGFVTFAVAFGGMLLLARFIKEPPLVTTAGTSDLGTSPQNS
jgi:exosortase